MTHFGHKNVIKYCNRPYSSVEEMNETLIKNWNSVIKEDDIVYHLGDFSFKSRTNSSAILARLKGKIHLITGNHDPKDVNGLHRFENVSSYKTINVPDKDAYRGNQTIIMFHYCIIQWDRKHYDSWHLFGHSHGTLDVSSNGKCYDVGVDTNEYRPVSYDQIKAIMVTKQSYKVDHHGN